MIRLENVSKSYVSAKIGVKKVLDDVCLEIPSDKSVGILGRNGAGKSTFMRLLSGTETPDVGRISMGDTRLSWPLGTSAGVHGSMTGRENIRFLCMLYDYPFEKLSNLSKILRNLAIICMCP